MKKIGTIERKIAKHKATIEKFRKDKTLDPTKKKKVIFSLQTLIRQLKWVLN